MARRKEGQPYELSPAQERMLKAVHLNGGSPFEGIRGRSANGGAQLTLSSLLREGYMLLAGGKYFASTAGEAALKRAIDRRAQAAIKAEPPRMVRGKANRIARRLVKDYVRDLYGADRTHLHRFTAKETSLVNAITRELREASRP